MAEQKAAATKKAAEAAAKEPAKPKPAKAAPAKPAGLKALKDMDVEVNVELGRTKVTLDEALDMGENSLVELNRRVGEPVEIRLNGKLFARGEVVTVSENFGVRITEIIGQSAE